MKYFILVTISFVKLLKYSYTHLDVKILISNLLKKLSMIPLFILCSYFTP